MLKGDLTETSLTDSAIADLVEKYLVADQNDQFAAKGRALLLQQIGHFSAQQQPLEFVLPGFPCKSPNDVDKSFSTMPDYGEVMAIERLDAFCNEINEIYGPGSELTILSDGTTFSDVVHVADEVKDNYKQALRHITVTENIKWADLSTMLNTRGQSDVDVRKVLLKSIAKGPRSFEKFVDQVRNDQAQSAVHDKLCSYLYYDIHLERFSEGERDNYLESISEKAHVMMYRGRALTHCIQNIFPQYIRLSIHQYDNSGPKYTFALSAGSQKAISPWHSVPVRLLNGQMVQLPHAIATERKLAKVTCGQHNWLYLEVIDPTLSKLSFEVIKAPKFGLRISDPQDCGYQHLSPAFLQRLSQEFGFVLLKDAPIETQSDLVSFCQPYGDIYQWSFGPVHVVKPEENPSGFVKSLEKTPLHWDLSMLPHSDENVQRNPRFAAKTFMLYCKTPPVKGEGQTTLVDSRMALKLAGQEKVKQWKQTEIIYNTKMTYFGGDPHTYPLVFEHPVSGDDILRYQEGSELEMQTFTLDCDSLADDEFAALVSEVNELAYSGSCLVEHQWQAGDLMIIDNYYTLHGRQPMTEKSMGRELWRVQVS